MFLGRRGTILCLFALAIAMVTEPQYVFGAATFWQRQYPEIQSGHATAVDCRGRETRKKSKNPLLGVVCLLTTGGLIRVRCYSWASL
jgi:hypothetical protein